MLPRFIQIHTLHSYPAALLNRDDSGLAKRLPFGGTVRTRVSSQCLKRHWRVAEDVFALGNIPQVETSVRSRETVTRAVIDPLRAAGAASDEVIAEIEKVFQTTVYGEKGDTRKGRQPLLLGWPEVRWLRARAEALCHANPADAKAAKAAAEAWAKDAKKNLEAMRKATALPAGIEAALFGRMVTSDTAANIDAAIHVAHAFTVHAEESESDYFSVVDDLKDDDDDSGADHIGDTELTSGLFYGYVVVDVPALVSNLEGCAAKDWETAGHTLAAQVIDHLVHLIAMVSPGAKLGSTAPYGYADLILIETGARQPRSLANAFRDACPPRVEAAITRLADYLGRLDATYGRGEARRCASLADTTIPGTEALALDALAKWCADAARDEVPA